MWRFIGGKILHLIPVLLLVSLAVMILINLIPGNPAYAILGTLRARCASSMRSWGSTSPW